MLDTTIHANPGSIQSAVDYLSRGVSHIDTWEADSRSAAKSAQEAWSGNAATGYVDHVTDGADAARDLSDEYTEAVEHLTTLLSALIQCIGAMDQARADARAAGLLVLGNTIYPPQRAAWDVYQDPFTTTPEYEAAAAQQNAWMTARDREYRARRTWANAIVRYRRDAITDTVSALLDVGTAGTQTALGIVELRVDRYAQHLESVDDMISSLSRNLDALKVDGAVWGGKQHFYTLDGELKSLLQRRAGIADSLDAATKLGSKLTKASGALGVIGFGYGAAVDLADGESTAQAFVSNGVDWGVAGAFTVGGAAAGSFIAPPIGTVVGGVVGAAVGVFAGGFANGFVDHWFENVSPDFGGAVSSGWDEVEKTGEQVGDLFTGVWNSVF